MSETSTEPELTILDTQLVQCTLVACAALLVYDWLCTLDLEVKYVWPFVKSPAAILFFLNRYLPFIDTFLSLDLKLRVSSPETCLVRFSVVTWFIVAGIILSETILILRTYALWERTRLIFIILCVSSLISFVPAIVITHLELKSLQYIPTTRPGCRLGAASPIIIVSYILLMALETTMAVLTAIRAYQHLRHAQSPWVRQLYQDGLLFYAYLLAISIANVLVPILAPRIFANWLATPQRVLHSVLSTRVLFLILQQRSSNMNERTPMMNRGQHTQTPIFSTFIDDGISANMTFVGQSALDVEVSVTPDTSFAVNNLAEQSKASGKVKVESS